ncbi:MAG: 5-Enolpyruvylshikimate-3-phosphate synthase [Micavibrio sp.]|nr:5-Enolpyruvylshikimate-3-phosphate synthase [Micavibrio sp.]
MKITRPKPMTASKSEALTGNVRIPGDKSISHRALMFGALAKGETMVSGLLEAGDVFSTAEALRSMGVRLSNQDGLWRIHGGNGLGEPANIIDMGNSGTSTRLLAGMIAGYDITATLTGDASLIKRPMARIMTPLTEMGATFMSRSGSRLPMSMRGSSSLRGIEYRLPVASAQVKSCILLAGLNASGSTTVIEDTPTRDHTETMLCGFGVEVTTETLGDGAQAITLKGGQMLKGCAIDVPGDPSTAAFPTIAALMVPGSELVLPHITMNPRRNGLYVTLLEMGADIKMEHERLEGGEPIADLRIRYNGPLKGITVPPERIASMIDEVPALAMVCACANGTSHLTNLGELRVKESDRLKMVADGLVACGVKLEMGEESLTIHGTGKAPKGGATIQTALDHRIAMSFLCLGFASEAPVTIDDISPVMTSFPSFVETMTGLGAQLAASDEVALDPDGLFLKQTAQ